MADERRCIVVLAPDVLAKSFVHYECREVLERWRDGAIVLVVTRSLLRRYLQLLRKMGLPDAQLRQWAVWFTARERAIYLPNVGDATSQISVALAEAGRQGNAVNIVTTDTGEHGRGETLWISVNEFLNL